MTQSRFPVRRPGVPARLGPLIFIHELGHYWVGRWFGVKAETFSIGFGREIAGWTDKRGTRWKVGWLPLGGYVKFAGDMNPASTPNEEWLTLPAEERAQTFQAKPVWQRFLIVLAGPRRISSSRSSGSWYLRLLRLSVRPGRSWRRSRGNVRRSRRGSGRATRSSRSTAAGSRPLPICWPMSASPDRADELAWVRGGEARAGDSRADNETDEFGNRGAGRPARHRRRGSGSRPARHLSCSAPPSNRRTTIVDGLVAARSGRHRPRSVKELGGPLKSRKCPASRPARPLNFFWFMT